MRCNLSLRLTVTIAMLWATHFIISRFGAETIVGKSPIDSKISHPAFHSRTWNSRQWERNNTDLVSLRERSSFSLPQVYTFHSKRYGSKSGKYFKVHEEFWMRYHFLLQRKYQVMLTSEVMDNFVVVMAVSRSHMLESIDAVASIQHNFPGKKIMYFDWGLEPGQKIKINSLCNVSLIPFDFNIIPHFQAISHKKPWHFQIAKAFVIAEALRFHSAVLWMDASIRLKTNNFERIFAKAVNSSGLVFFSTVYHSTYSVTPPGMFRYLPSSTEEQQKIDHVQSGAIFIVRTKLISENIIWWFLLCSYTEDCVFSEHINSLCPRKSDAYKRNMSFNCSRFDQSVLNVLASNLYDFNVRQYCLRDGQGKEIAIQRKRTAMYQFKECQCLNRLP